MNLEQINRPAMSSTTNCTYPTMFKISKLFLMCLVCRRLITEIKEGDIDE